MSTRYVWGKYSVNTTYKETTASTDSVRVYSAPYVSNNYTNSDGTYTFNGINTTQMEEDTQYNTGTFPYCMSGRSSNFLYLDNNSRICFWLYSEGVLRLRRLDNTFVYFTMKQKTPEQSKGTLQGYASSATDGAYPADGVSGNSWYTKQGSDNIDASAVSIPSTIMGGTQITITVTPGTGKVYAGTVSYIYQVKLGSGSWQTIATTTATTRTYTVPYGTESIQVRVQAKDDIGFTSSDYVTSSAVTVINNQPPTAPGSIEVTNVVSGQQCTITITAATDPDGTVESYIYERSVDGSAWQQIANVNALTHNDTISAEWGTVAYRVCAVDDDGDSGPYVTSETTTVNSGWIIISGPAADMGDKPAPFNFTFTQNVTGQTGVTDISVVVTLDGEEIYNDTPDAGQEVSIPIDTRLMRAGEHTIQVAATKTDFLEASGSYEFNIPAITLPDGGIAEMLQNPEGKVIFPYTLARLVIGKDGKDLNELLEGLLKSAAKIQVGTYIGTGTYGSANPNSLTFDFVPNFVIIDNNGFPSSQGKNPLYYLGKSLQFSNSSSVYAEMKVTGKTLTWFNTSEGLQKNENDTEYSYVAIGKMPTFGNISVVLETSSFSESENIIWNFSIPEGITILTGGSKSVSVTMTRGGSSTAWTQERYITYTVEGADGSGKTVNGLVRISDSDPAPTFNIPISNVFGDIIKIKITNVSANG